MTDSEKDSPKVEKAAEGWTSLLTVIPEMFYDVLARIFPGLALVLALSVYEEDLNKAIPQATQWATNAFVLVALSYLCGMMLSAFSAFLAPLVWKISMRIIRMNPHLDSGFKKAPLTLTGFSILAARRLDDLSRVNAESARILVKMMAEVEICQSLAAGILVFFPLLMFLPPSHPTHFAYPYRAAVVCVVLFVVLLVATIYRLTIYFARLDYFCRTLLDAQETRLVLATDGHKGPRCSARA